MTSSRACGGQTADLAHVPALRAGEQWVLTLDPWGARPVGGGGAGAARPDGRADLSDHARQPGKPIDPAVGQLILDWMNRQTLRVGAD